MSDVFERAGVATGFDASALFAKRTVLVAGGAGFIGSHLCARLLAGGAVVLCVDDLSTGRLQNVKSLLSHPCFSFIQHDITQPLTLRGAVDDIFNLACPASPPKYQIDPVQTMRINVIGMMNLLDLARQKGARILQASTSEVYGDPEIAVQSESYWGHVNCYGPRACYDEGKRAAETLCYDYRTRYGVDTKIVRIFNTYGPNMDPEDGRVVSNFVVQALRGLDITINGTGAQTRSFCYVDDLVEGVLRLMTTGPDFGDPVNLGNPSEFMVRDLADIVLSKVNSSSRIVFRDLPRDDPQRRRPDIALAARLLGWHPTVALSDGLDRTIAYFEGEIARGLPLAKVS